MKITNLKSRINFCIQNSITPLIFGGPGIGKSQTVESLVQDQGWEYEPFIPSFASPHHVGGLPMKVEVDGRVEAVCIPLELGKRIFSHKGNNLLVVHIEDLIQATPLLQATLMSLIHKRSINGVQIPDTVRFVIDTNRAGDRAGGNSIIEPMKSRTWQVDFPLDINNWIHWGIESGRIDKRVLAFVKSNPDAFYVFQPSAKLENYPCPRTWEIASKFVREGFVDGETLAGCVGNEEGHNLASFLAELKDFGFLLGEVLKDPYQAKTFDNLSKVYGAGLILARNLEKKNIEKIYTYLNRYNNDEITNFVISLGCEIHPDSKETKVYQKTVLGLGGAK